jgi:uncharacterized protein (TIGR03083 family)
MASSELWSTIHRERAALAQDLGSLTDAQWDTPSLCEGWSVRDVLGHMTATAKQTVPKFFGGLVGSGFRFEAMLDRLREAQLGDSPADTLARFESAVDSTSHPPGPADAWLGETIVHSVDIRRPLGITHQVPLDAVTTTADFYRKSNLVIGGKKRSSGLTFQATDTDWSAGEGPEVKGPALSLLLAITGRKAALGDLSGDGVATLRDRM